MTSSSNGWPLATAPSAGELATIGSPRQVRHAAAILPVAAEDGERRSKQAFQQLAFRPDPGEDTNAQENGEEKPGKIFGRLRARDGSGSLPRYDATAEESLHLSEHTGHHTSKLGILWRDLECGILKYNRTVTNRLDFASSRREWRRHLANDGAIMNPKGKKVHITEDQAASAWRPRRRC